MLPLRENVFLDLPFDESWDHKEHAGWRQMFTAWSQSEIILKTREVSQGTYGLRFQQFFENRQPERGRKSAGA